MELKLKKFIASTAAATALVAGCSPEQTQAEFYPDDQPKTAGVESLLTETEECDAQIPKTGSEAYIQEVIESHEAIRVIDGVHYYDLMGMPECDYLDLVNSITESVYEGRDSGPFAFANRFSAKTDGEDTEYLSIVAKETDQTVASPIIFGDIVMRYAYGDGYTEDQLLENAESIEDIFYSIANIGNIEHEYGYLFDLIIIDYDELTEALDEATFTTPGSRSENSRKA